MQWSNNSSRSRKPGTKGILPKSVADSKVLSYQPININLGTPSQALEYLKSKKMGADFVMGEPTKVTTGVDKIEEISNEERVEQAAIEKLKEIQENAYKEAYALGLDQGSKLAFEKKSFELQEKIESLEKLLRSIADLKTEMITFNESHIIQLVFHMASKLATREVQIDSSIILDIIKSAVSLTKEEEKINVLVSSGQLEFLESMKKESKRELDFLKNINFIASTDVSDGGCIVETNYGEVDARIEQRVAQLWQNIVDGLPKVKNRIAG